MFAVIVSMVSPAAAHLAIRLDIRYPQPGAHVGHDVDVVVFAQPTLAGVAQTTYSATLDGHPLDPRTGRFVAQAEAPLIRANTDTRIPLRGLPRGPHELAIAYRPDADMPILHTSVAFTVGGGGSHGALLAVVLAVVALGLMALAVLGLRRRRSKQAQASASARGVGSSAGGDPQASKGEKQTAELADHVAVTEAQDHGTG